MAVCNDIVGKYVTLRCVDEDDAEFTLSIRQDEEFIKYLPAINNTLEQQKAWIKKQRMDLSDYFFAVWDKNGNRIGTIGVFDIFSNPPKVGRLAMKGNALQNIEAHLLILQFAFYTLALDNLWGFVYAENKRAIRFDLQYGADFAEPSVYSDGRMIREVIFSKLEFEKCLQKLFRNIYRNETLDTTMTFYQNIMSFRKNFAFAER